MLDEMDETFGVGELIEAEQKKIKRVRQKDNNLSLTAGLIVGHSKEDFIDGSETILVLKDKNVLDEDDEEVLINPNLLENERHKRNVELKKKRSNYKPYEEEFDEFGQPTKQGILSKYDDEMNEEKHETFRLDEAGGVDIDKEAQEAEMKRKLFMANKKFESLDTTKSKLATEFYTEV